MHRVGEETVYEKTVTFQSPIVVPAAQQFPVAAMRHQHLVPYSQVGTTASETRTIRRVMGTTGLLKKFGVACKVSCIGAATITVDLKLNGTSVLSGGTPITLNSSSVAATPTYGTITTTALAAGDYLEQVIVATAGGGTIGTGFDSMLAMDEDVVS